MRDHAHIFRPYSCVPLPLVDCPEPVTNAREGHLMKRIVTAATLTIAAAALAAVMGAPAASASAAPHHVTPHCWIYNTQCVR